MRIEVDLGFHVEAVERDVDDILQLLHFNCIRDHELGVVSHDHRFEPVFADRIARSDLIMELDERLRHEVMERFGDEHRHHVQAFVE